ncbi:MAG: hypothetical protein C4313_02375 [Thermoflexus sp.]|uniref:M50 family metallopeptidase n=1 Tax=Thermoflexus sp. TaxID=1969742 RepID=UPI00331AE224
MARRSAFPLLTVAGVPVRVHWTLLALLAMALLGAGALAGGRAALRQGLWWGMLFGAVLIHELGHLLAARLLGLPVTEVVLWPLGGFTMIRLPPARFGAELIIALAGPGVNLLLAAGIHLLGIAPDADGITSEALRAAGWVNALLGLFNLMPVFPMDGGRILRGLLALGLREDRGTRLALRVGQAGAMGMGSLAAWQFLHQDPGGLVTMTLAMWLSGQTLQEARRLHQRERLRAVPAAAHRIPLRVAINDRVSMTAARRLLAHTGQPVLPVENAGRWSEVLSLRRGALQREAPPTAGMGISLDTAWDGLSHSVAEGLLLLHHGRPVGWLPRERVEAMFREAP